MRLIDADEIRIKPEYMHDISGVVMIRVEDIARILNDMPPIEPERKKSKLIVDDFNTEIWGANSNCNLCGCSWQINDRGVDNFCPNCGADVRGEEDA